MQDIYCMDSHTVVVRKYSKKLKCALSKLNFSNRISLLLMT